MVIKKFGLRDVDEIPLHTYAEAGRLDRFGIHAGDPDGHSQGNAPGPGRKPRSERNSTSSPILLTRANQQDELKLTTADATAKTQSSIRATRSSSHATLKDGRILDLKTEVDAQRPAVSVLTKSIQLDPKSVAVRPCGSAARKNSRRMAA